MKLFILVLSCLVTLPIIAQDVDFHVGLRIGFNYSHLDGPVEENAKLSTSPGFHVGPTFTFRFSDLMGIRGELLFSQKGAKFEYNGPSYFTIRKNNEYIPTSGTRNMLLTINNNYIDLPLSFYTLLFERLDVSFGGYGSVLVGSNGKGDMTYSGKRDNSNASVGPIKFLLEQNYLRDKAGTTPALSTIDVRLEGDVIKLPEQLGGYYEYRTKPDGHKYNTLDYGLAAGLHYRFSGGLYIGARYQFGLADVTNKDFDISYKTLTSSKDFVLIPAVHKNRTLQISLMLQL